jgi:uncharacterized membrane protein
MEIEAQVEIDRPPDVVWPVMVDIERWPDWTPSITAVERLDASLFGIGSRVRIRQPRLKTMVWQVSQFREGRLFVWDARSPGVFIVGSHEVKARAHGSTVILKIKQTGWLTPLVTLLFGNLTRRYVQMEAQGLKRRCELLPNPARV